MEKAPPKKRERERLWAKYYFGDSSPNAGVWRGVLCCVFITACLCGVRINFYRSSSKGYKLKVGRERCTWKTTALSKCSISTCNFVEFSWNSAGHVPTICFLIVNQKQNKTRSCECLFLWYYFFFCTTCPVWLIVLPDYRLLTVRIRQTQISPHIPHVRCSEISNTLPPC